MVKTDNLKICKRFVQHRPLNASNPFANLSLSRELCSPGGWPSVQPPTRTLRFARQVAARSCGRPVSHVFIVILRLDDMGVGSSRALTLGGPAKGGWFLMHHVNVAWIVRPQSRNQSIQSLSMTLERFTVTGMSQCVRLCKCHRRT